MRSSPVIILTSMYYKPHFGGIENSIFQLGKVAKKCGYRVIIVCSDAPMSGKVRLPKYEQSEAGEIFRFPHFSPQFFVLKLFSPIINTISAFRLARNLRKELSKTVLVLTRHYITGVAFYLAKFKNIIYLVPGVVSTQDTLPLKDKGIDTKHRIKNFLLLRVVIPQNIFLQRRLLRVTKRNFVFSTFMSNQLKIFAGAKSTKIMCGVDTNTFKPRCKTDVRKKLKLEQNSFYCLCLGRVTIHKGFKYAIEALAFIPDMRVRLIIVGDGPELSTLEDLTNSLNLGSRVLFFEKTDTPELFFAASDLFLMTSVFETFGQTILEGMASGLPVVAFDSTQVQTATNEIISRNVNGFIVPFSSKELAKAINFAFNEEKIVMTVSENAINDVRIKYSWESLFEELK